MVRQGAGFTLVEFMVATTITLVALSLAAALVAPVADASQSLPEAADAQQRLRTAVEALVSDLSAAGAGPSLAWGAGAASTWPAILPCRWTGGPLAAVVGGCARSDSFTVLAMAPSAPQAMTVGPLEHPTAPLDVEPASACSLDRSACRLHAGSLALLIDGTGAWDLLTMTSISADGRQVAHAQGALSGPYVSGALIGEIGAHGYYLAADPQTGGPQLRRVYDGGYSFPLVDHTVALSVQYFGDPLPPAVIADGGTAIRVTTYGPIPPRPGVDNPLDGWPAGENCIFAADGERQIPRMAALPAGPTGLAALPVSMFVDGPWCPDASSPNRFDADLLRIRLVRVTLRVQAQSPAVRGAMSGWFSNPGTARNALRLVPDLEVSVDVAPRNLRR